MISSDALKQFQFFGVFTDTQLKALAALSQDVSALDGTVIFQEGEQADALYFLLDGEVDLYTIVSATNPTRLYAGEINPGDPFGVSALLEPFVYRTSARAPVHSRFLKMDVDVLRPLMDQDCELGLLLMKQVMRATLERVEVLRLQIAAISRHRDDDSD